MKKVTCKLSVRFIFISLLLGIISSSCSKYEDGPFVSVYSKKMRIAGWWSIKAVEINGINDTTNYNGTWFLFGNDGDGKFEMDYIDYPLEWEFNDTKEQLRFRVDFTETGMPEWSEDDWVTILKLTNTDMWWKEEYDFDSDGTDDEVVTKLRSDGGLFGY